MTQWACIITSISIRQVQKKKKRRAYEASYKYIQHTYKLVCVIITTIPPPPFCPPGKKKVEGGIRKQGGRKPMTRRARGFYKLPLLTLADLFLVRNGYYIRESFPLGRLGNKRRVEIRPQQSQESSSHSRNYCYESDYY